MVSVGDIDGFFKKQSTSRTFLKEAYSIAYICMLVLRLYQKVFYNLSCQKYKDQRQSEPRLSPTLTTEERGSGAGGSPSSLCYSSDISFLIPAWHLMYLLIKTEGIIRRVQSAAGQPISQIRWTGEGKINTMNFGNENAKDVKFGLTALKMKLWFKCWCVWYLLSVPAADALPS